MKALNANASDRYESALEFKNAIDTYVHEEGKSFIGKEMKEFMQSAFSTDFQNENQKLSEIDSYRTMENVPSLPPTPESELNQSNEVELQSADLQSEMRRSAPWSAKKIKLILIAIGVLILTGLTLIVILLANQ
jgi:hypothetical protein